jgi:hypothetical protein
MGGSKPSPSPTVIYSPPPPPPAPPTPVPTQSVQTQAALNEVSGKQMRLNMELGAQLDRTNADFFAGQDIRRTQASGAEQRLTIGKTAEEERASRKLGGEEERKTVAATGTEYRAGLQTAGGEERKTALQQEMFRRYKENRDYEQAQQQYRT